MLIWLPILLLSTAAAAPPAAEPTPPAPLTAPAVFERLGSLVGTWQGTSPSGRTFTVTYRLTAAGTVLVETWTLGSGRESMTMYHLDGNNVLATHYCPIGNQPTLELALPPGGPTGDGPLVFGFRSATNLLDPGVAHQHRFELRFPDTDHFWRSETYVENGEEGTEAVTYQRLP